MHSLAIRHDDEPGEGGDAEADALAKVASAAQRVAAVARTGSQPLLIARAITGLTEATMAAEDLTARRLAIRAVAEAEYNRGFADGAASHRLRAIRPAG